MTIQSNNIVNQGPQVITIPQKSIYYPTYPFNQNLATTALINNSAYFLFLGQTTQAFTPLKLYIPMSLAGTGTASHAVGFFSSTTAPNSTNLTMTRIVATSTITTNVTTIFALTNTSNFGTSVTVGTYLWACYISAYSSTQTSVYPIWGDCGNGALQIAAGSSVANVTGGSPIAASINNGIGPKSTNAYFTF